MQASPRPQTNRLVTFAGLARGSLTGLDICVWQKHLSSELRAQRVLSVWSKSCSLNKCSVSSWGLCNIRISARAEYS